MATKKQEVLPEEQAPMEEAASQTEMNPELEEMEREEMHDAIDAEGSPPQTETETAESDENSADLHDDAEAEGALSQTEAQEPKQNESAAQTEAPKKPAAEPPAAEQQPLPEPVVPEKPVEQPPEPEKPKSIYDYAFDADAIRSELIAIGQSMGLTHITEDDGIPCTPDTCSWASPVTASESFQGDNLKRALQNYVTSMPSTIASYGGTQITSFTIYVQDNGGGGYTFYFLY